MKPRAAVARRAASRVGGEARSPSAFERVVEAHLQRFVPLLAAVLSSDDADAVHDLRVLSRRLQGALDALTGAPRPPAARRLVRMLRRIRRDLGEWRNHDVVLELVEGRARRSRSARRRGAWRLVAERLAVDRRRQAERARRRLLRKDLAGFVPAVRRMLASAPADTPESPLVRAAVERSLERFRASLDQAEVGRDPTSIHALRIAAKRLRYSIELAVELGEGDLKAVVGWLKDLQETLGSWHDRQNLYRLCAEALGRPEILLGDSETLRIVLADLARERERDPGDVAAIFELSLRSEPARALERWLRPDEGERPGETPP
jgi:CHAD domain-containing protein